MRKLLVTLDDELSKKLEAYPNQNEVVRKSLRLYIGDITTDSIEGMRVSYQILQTTHAAILKQLSEINAKLDYLAREIK